MTKELINNGSDKFKIIIRLKEVGSVGSFSEAFSLFSHHIMEAINKSQITSRDLETTCWIEGPDGEFISFEQCRQKAISAGLITKNGLTGQ